MWPFKKQSADGVEPVFPPTASTGIAGLDELLRGGLVREDMHLIQGAAGTGKTTVALRFLLAGVEAGEAGLFISLSQSAKGLENIARSHGWSLDGITVHELSPLGVAGQTGGQQTVLHTADVELGEITRDIRAVVERVQPRRAVFDSMGTLGLLAGSSHRYHAEIASLRQLLIEHGCTVLFLGDQPVGGQAAGGPDAAFHSLAGSITYLEQSSPEYGQARRRLRIVKVRGLPHQSGYHNFKIHTGGLDVFPRLSGYDKPEYRDYTSVPSGIQDLDRLLGGGLELGTACLFVGPSGAGKSTLAGVFVHAAARRGEDANIFLFDERPETFLARSAGVGVDLRPHVDTGLVLLEQVDTAAISPGEFSQRVREAIELRKAKVVVLDSLTGYFNAMARETMLAEQMHDLLNYLSRQGVLTLLVITQEGITSVGPAPPVDISYLSDTILVLRQFEAEGRVRRCLVAVKKRQGEHETTIRELLIQPGGVQVGERLDRFQSILSGDPKPLGASEQAGK